MPEITLIDAIREAMDEELARDERVFITGEDVGPRGGVFRATMGLFDKYGPQRIIDSPLAELSIVAIGVGAVHVEHPAWCTRPRPLEVTSGLVPPGNFSAYQSRHHSVTLPCMSRSPQSFGFFKPT